MSKIELPKEIQDRFALEITRFCVETQVPTRDAITFASNLSLIIADYFNDNFDPNYVEKPNDEIVKEILREL